MIQTTIYVDGEIRPAGEAVLPVLDHGFLFGDSVYEVIWLHRGALVQGADHLGRLEESAARIYMDLQFSREELVAAVRRTADAAGVRDEDDAYVRLIVTRGVGPLGLDFSKVPRRSLVVIVGPASRPDGAARERGISVAVVRRRRTSSQALDPRAKTGNYLNNVLALHEARMGGADDALMLNDLDRVTEATTANVFLLLDGRLVTPSLEAGILKGTTRTRILALAAESGIEAVEREVTREDLERAREIFLSSSVKGILPVTRVDGRTVGEGCAGPRTLAFHRRFEEAADEEAEAARRLRE